jgi:hypothetical protein
MDLIDRLIDLSAGFAERGTFLQIKRDGGSDEKALVIDGKRRVAGLIIADSGTIVSTAVLTAAPDDVLLLPPVASELIAALRAELLLAVATAVALEDSVDDPLEAEDATTVPPGRFDVADPAAPPPDVAT